MSGGWKQQAKKQRKPTGTLTDWCDANLPSTIGARVALLVSKNEASPRVVGILKSYRTRSEVLSNVQRRGLEAELKGAGSWSGGEAPSRRTAAPRQRAPAAGAAAGQRHGTDRASDMAALRAENASLKAAAAAGPAEDQPSRRARRAARRVTFADTEPAALPVEVDGESPAAAGWQCAVCGRSHAQLARQCRICATKRVPTPMAATDPAVRAEAVPTVAAADLQRLIAGLTGCGQGQTTAMLTTVAELQARLDDLLKPAAPAPVPDETARLRAGQNAVKAAVARVAALTDKTTGLNARLAELQLDAVALQRSLADAQRQQVEAEKALAVVRQAVGAQAPAPGHAASAEPACRRSMCAWI